MLPGEGVLPPETLSAIDGLTVNDVFKYTGELVSAAHRGIFDNWLKRLQESWLDDLLGPRWRPLEHGGVTCPACGGKSHTRKGFRERGALTSRGRFQFPLAQVKCDSCGRVHRPFVERLGLASRRRVLPELEDKALSLALRLPYRVSAELLKELSGGGLSHEGVREAVSKAASEEEIVPPAEVVHGQVDSTKVLAGIKPGGEALQLAISVERGPESHGRPTLVKKLVHLSVGDSVPLKAALRKAMPKYLVHDGELDLTGIGGCVQRCLWHMDYQLDYCLWQDKLPVKERRGIRDKLRGILYGTTASTADYYAAYDNLADDLKGKKLRVSAGYLERAKAEVFSYRNDRGLVFATTSPIEREMREINRRADVGARWSIKGIENILKLLMLKRYNQLSKNMHPG